jgi:dUTP pyrophosphatase
MGFSFVREFLPPSPIGSRIWRLTDEDLDLDPGFAPAAAEPAPNGSDPLDSHEGEAIDPEPAMSVGTITRPTASATRLREMEELRFIRLSEKATLPTRAHDNDSGLDLYSAEAARIVTGARVSVGTGLAVAIPEGLAGLVLPRSGLALKHGVTLVNSPGLIDPGYRGEVRILLLNTDQTLDFQVKPGDRIAQLLLVPVASASPLQADSLDETTRGEAGFGSSGF